MFLGVLGQGSVIGKQGVIAYDPIALMGELRINISYLQ